MKVFTGSYTTKSWIKGDSPPQGIGYLEIDEQDWSLIKKAFILQTNPSYIAISSNKRVLYSVEETCQSEAPKVRAYYIIDEAPFLIPFSEKEIAGTDACHIAICENHLILSCYGSGNLLSYPLLEDGSIGQLKQSIYHHGNGPNKARQESAHVHMCLIHEDWLWVADLGIDKCKAYYFSNGQLISKADRDIILPPGSGPRHMEKHPNLPILYVFCELSAEVLIVDLSFDPPKQIGQINAFEKLPLATPSGAAIKTHPSGKYLFLSERSSNSLACLVIEPNGMLRDENIHSLEDVTPRDFFLSKNGEILISGGQDSNTLSIYRFDSNHGTISSLNIIKNVTAVSCVLAH